MHKHLLASAAVVLLALSPGARSQSIVYMCGEGEQTFVSDKRVDGGKCEGVTIEVPPRWKKVARSASDDVVTVDADTIVRNGSLVSAWVQYFHLKQRPYVASKGIVDRTLQRQTFDCTRSMSTIEAFIQYDDGKRVVDSGSIAHPAWELVAPDTVSEAVWSFLCRG